ncbi:ABC transporter ATP-binding protein/permease [Paenibacillus timonensis]|uniref:ABC transporter ATP-binding protein n=1 Tax=Paenibacillus timonensis TaxID=225915 RepID=A0ABW3SB35_9BACL|nr:ABC transporter ATP-binding protein [Paenibacillus timonensis]MCH1640129.1 ABC transporter ATP-binding protein/permease [Paenibacillus timonensis]
MKNILLFIRKMYDFAGIKLVINLLSMIMISLLDGIGIFLLVPMLGLIGIFQLSTEEYSFFAIFDTVLKGIPETYQLIVILGSFSVIIAAQALFQKYQSVLDAKIQQGFMRNIRLDIYQALLKANWVFHLKRRKSDFQHILTSELGRVNQGTTLFLRLLTSMTFMAIQIGIALWLSYKITLLVLLCGILLALISRTFIQYSREYGNQTTELAKRYYAGINDQFNGIKDIKSNMLERSQISWFRKLNRDIETNVIKQMRMQSNSQLLYKVSSAILIGVFIYISLNVFQAQTGQLMIIIILFSRLWPKFTSIQSNMEQMASVIPSFKNLVELQQECESAIETIALEHHHNNQSPLRITEGIECRNLFFRYDQNGQMYALNNVSLFVPANEMTAIVGKSGAGKSTLIDTLMGLIWPESGQVLVDGTPLTDEMVLSLRQSIGYVSQDPFLFHTTIRDNLLIMNPDASEDDIWDALKLSAADEFIKRLPQGLDTEVGDRGVRLSGGERQRLVLARTILRKPSILILDEPTSSLDVENEKRIQDVLNRLKGEMTIIVIAHRLSTIRNADQVVVLENGKVIQEGGYQQLSQEASGVFGRLLKYQTELNVQS